jgi:hypothetical protein
MRAKYNILSDLEEKSNAQGQEAIQVGLNDTLVIKEQIKAEAGFNNQGHPQLQVEQKSVHSKRTPEVNITESSCASREKCVNSTRFIGEL